jgi:hypothetical protein
VTVARKTQGMTCPRPFSDRFFEHASRLEPENDVFQAVLLQERWQALRPRETQSVPDCPQMNAPYTSAVSKNVTPERRPPGA